MKYKEKDGEYIIYTFPLEETWENVNYVVIYFNPYNEISYLSVLISPYEKKTLAFTEVLLFNEEFTFGDSLKKYETIFNFFVKLIKGKNKNLTIEIKLHEDDEPEFFINTYEIDQDYLGPDSSIIKATTLSVPDSNKTVNPNYIQYNFNYTNVDEKTLSFNVQVYSSYLFKYFSICVGDGNCTSSQDISPDSNSGSGSGSGQGSGVSAGIIVLIVILSFSIIIIALIILKKKGYCRYNRVSSDSL